MKTNNNRMQSVETIETKLDGEADFIAEVNGRKLWAYRIEVSKTSSHSPHDGEKTSRVERSLEAGICYASQYALRFAQMDYVIQPPHISGRGERRLIYAVNHGFEEGLRKHGFHSPEGNSTILGLNRVKDPLAQLRSDAPSFELVQVYGHRVWRLDGTPIPVRLTFDYIDGLMTDEHFDLEHAAVLLHERDDVTLAHHDKRSDLDNPAEYTDPLECIDDIPGYNRTERAKRRLLFYWHPKQEDYERVCAAGLALGDLRLHWAAHAIDIFGLGGDCPLLRDLRSKL